MIDSPFRIACTADDTTPQEPSHQALPPNSIQPNIDQTLALTVLGRALTEVDSQASTPSFHAASLAPTAALPFPFVPAANATVPFAAAPLLLLPAPLPLPFPEKKARGVPLLAALPVPLLPAPLPLLLFLEAGAALVSSDLIISRFLSALHCTQDEWCLSRKGCMEEARVLLVI